MNELSEEDFIKAMYQKAYEAEQRMMNQFHEELLSGTSDAIEFTYQPPTPTEKITEAAWKVYYFFRCRIVGVWNVLKKGECGDCERGNKLW